MKRIIVENVSKKFRIGTTNQNTLSAAKNIFSGREQRKNFQVLENISFTADSGEVIGIIGKNGSGKSTLLRIIAGIYSHDTGKIITRGKIVSLIGMSEGLDLRLSARDNIFLCCSLMGLKTEEIKKRFKEVISFAELEKFTDTKLYQFSSGMIARLAFSIAIHSINQNPDILLLDEIFAVGDEGFKDKCSEKIKELVKTGSTILIVSHELEMLKKNCKRIIWIDNGKIRKEGGNEILREYKNYSYSPDGGEELLRIYEEYKKKYKIKKLHIACQKNILDSWLNIDKTGRGDVLSVNIANPLMFEDCIFDYVFIENMFQHYTPEVNLKFLKECFRTLKPGGKIRIVVPSMEFILGEDRKNRKKHKEYIEWMIDTYLRNINESEDTSVINLLFKNWFQEVFYDQNTLKSDLKKTGFIGIKKCNPQESEDKNLKNIERDDWGKYKFYRLIFEAEKSRLSP